MTNTRWYCCALVLMAACVMMPLSASADDVVSLVIPLLHDKDKDVRALGLEQVRSEVKGAEATRQFAAQLTKLPADAQVGLLSALSDRGDAAARPAVVELLEISKEPAVRVAAIGAVGALGQADDATKLVPFLSSASAAEQKAARKSLVNLRDEAASEKIAAAIKDAGTPVRVVLLDVLTVRRASGQLQLVVPQAVDADAAVRAAAMKTLGELAGPQQVAGMVQGVLKAEKGPEREAAERAVAAVCLRQPKDNDQAEPLLQVMDKLGIEEGAVLLPTLGRIGSPAARKRSEDALAKKDAKLHALGLRALCNWPDATIAARLLELAQKEQQADQRAIALMALVRVAPLPDKRPLNEKLGLLKQATELCTKDSQRNQVLKRASAVRSVDSLRFVLPYVDQPAFSAQACESIVELAHHRGLREPNKAEFHAALDKVIKTSKDATVLDRANRYKKDQTWAKPTKQE